MVVASLPRPEAGAPQCVLHIPSGVTPSLVSIYQLADVPPALT